MLLATGDLADVLNFLRNSIVGSEIQFQSPAKKLKKDLKANFGDSRVVTALGKLITNEGICVDQRLILTPATEING